MRLLLLQKEVPPFLSSMTITSFNQSSGTLTSVQTFLKITSDRTAEDSPSYFSNSLLIHSKPGDVWFFNLQSVQMIYSVSAGMTGKITHTHKKQQNVASHWLKFLRCCICIEQFIKILFPTFDLSVLISDEVSLIVSDSRVRFFGYLESTFIFLRPPSDYRHWLHAQVFKF